MGTKKELRENGSQVLKKSNLLIRAMFRRPLVDNQVVMLALASKDKTMEGNSICCHIKQSELQKYFDISEFGGYKKLHRVGRRLGHWLICVEDKRKGAFAYINVVDKSVYENGELTIRFNQDLTQYINDIGGDGYYTKLPLDIMFRFKSMYSFRLYEILSSYCYHGSKEEIKDRPDTYRIVFDVSALRFFLGVVDADDMGVAKEISGKQEPDFDKAISSFLGVKVSDMDDEMDESDIESDSDSTNKRVMGSTTWANFSRRILVPAIDEINSMKDDPDTPGEIYIFKDELKVVRKGRGGKISSIEFVVQKEDRNKKKETREYSEAEKLMIVAQIYELFGGKLTMPGALEIAMCAEYDLDLVRLAANKCDGRGDIRDYCQWAKAVIRERMETGNAVCESEYCES